MQNQLPASNDSFQTRRIWHGAPHCAFTDLVFFGGRWLCCFRESDSHALGRLGIIRIIESSDGEEWKSSHVFSDSAYDLRDPHFSLPGDGRLMLNMAGRTQVDGEYVDLQSFASFSRDGAEWSDPTAMACDGYWIWQLRWHEGIAYSWARKVVEGLPYAFFRSPDGIRWEPLVQLDGGSETALSFLPDGQLLAFRRHREAALLALSAPPFREWDWQSTGRWAGGPNLFPLSDGRILAGCRFHRADAPREERSYFSLALVDLERRTLRLVIDFPVAQDCGYPGIFEKGSELWVSHYSGTKTDSAIHLSRIPVTAFKGGT